MENTLLYIIIALGISIVLNIFLKKIGISQIIGYILTGTLIVYLFDLRDASHSHELELIGEFGIVFLMFTIGLEISLGKMNSMRQQIFGNGFLQVGLTSVLFYFIAHYVFNVASTPSLLIALAFSLSSTAVVLSYLKSSKEIYRPYGQNATGILIFQDIAVIPILILIGFLTTEGDEGVATILWHTLTSAVVVVGLLFIVGKRLVSWLLHFSASSELDELFMGSVLFIVVGASLFASAMGFTYSLGAFVVGMIIAETRYHHKVEADIAPFKDLLLGTFFVTVGMKIDVMLFVDNIGSILLLFLLVFIFKSIIVFGVLKLSNNVPTSLKAALSLSQVGEFSFVIFALATSGGLLDPKLSMFLVLIVIFSMMITPFFISKINDFVNSIVKEQFVQTDFSTLKGKQNHVIVCGYGVVGKFVAQQLEELGIDFVVIDNSNKHVIKALKHGRDAYLGDASKTSILDALHIDKAAAIIVTLDNVEKKYNICEAVLEHSKDANVVVKATTLAEQAKLSHLPITSIVDGKVEVARVLVDRMITCQLETK
ncbi:cation:proton antiporter [Sulfurimonas sp. C5]|uniref:cation:proton antiporter domain-containing protein n=1 Tax=Sulfurimonas sp. C5 TaxID=3036947 RepID=UPI0024557126|nr:cation:proton antiporter [Sulfurimonas sp. C5]MDH4944903.1 cation:proton antiporter [Sulfurimonas sp. C5]